MAEQKKDRGALVAVLICLLLAGALIFDICFLFPSCEGWDRPGPSESVSPEEDEYELFYDEEDGSWFYLANPELDNVKIYADPGDRVGVCSAPDTLYEVMTVGLGNGRALVSEKDYSGPVLACCWRFENHSSLPLELGCCLGEVECYTENGMPLPLIDLKAEGCENVYDVSLAPGEVKYFLALFGTPGDFSPADSVYVQLDLPSQSGIVRDILWEDLSGNCFSELPVFGREWPYWSDPATQESREESREESMNESGPVNPPSYERYLILEDEDGGVLYVPNPRMPYVPIELRTGEKVLAAYRPEREYKVTLLGLCDASEMCGEEGMLACIYRFENRSKDPLYFTNLFDKGFMTYTDGSSAPVEPLIDLYHCTVYIVKLEPGETKDACLFFLPEKELSDVSLYLNLPTDAGTVDVGCYFPLYEGGALPKWMPADE